MSPRAARHILIARRVFGDFDSLLDFCRKVDRTLVTRQDLLLLIKLDDGRHVLGHFDKTEPPAISSRVVGSVSESETPLFSVAEAK